VKIREQYAAYIQQLLASPRKRDQAKADAEAHPAH